MFLAIIAYFLSIYLIFIIQHKAIFNWWNSTGGKNYSKQLSISSLLLSNDNVILYYIINLFSSVPVINSLKIDQIRFLLPLLSKQRFIDPVTNMQQGILTAKALCENILLSPADGDIRFNSWYKDSNKDMASEFTYTSEDKTVDSIVYTIYTQIVDKNTKKFGVYPSSGNYDGWKCLISQWLGPNWGWTKSSDASTSYFGFKYYGTDKPKSQWFDKFYDGYARPDNILARYGIKYQSPLILSFCNDAYSYNGIVLDVAAFKHLIGEGIYGNEAGGWMGYVLGMGGNTDEFENYYSTEENISFPSPPACDKMSLAENVGSSILAGGSTVGFAIPMLSGGLALEAGPLGGLFLLAVGIGSMVAAGLKNSSKIC
jgi:hypothetical protein